MNKLIYPTLDLFIYDLREGLGENTEEIAENLEYFQRRLPGRLHARTQTTRCHRRGIC